LATEGCADLALSIFDAMVAAGEWLHKSGAP
jgi:hypothetical protein